jgi:hypothetical protein
LSEEQVRQGLRRIHYERKGRERIPLQTLAAFVGIGIDTLRKAIYGGPISLVTRAKLTLVIQASEQGRLRCARRGQVWDLSIADDMSTPPVPMQHISAPPGSTFGGPS